MEKFVKTEVRSGVGRITLCRAEKRNALKRDFIDQLNAAVEAFSIDDSLRVVVIQAEGTVFCAGMDLSEMQERAQSDSGKQEWQKDSEVYAKLLSGIYHLKVPTIAVLQGPVLAGGVGMVLACDFIVANADSFIMLPEPARGITAAMVTPLLVERVGIGAATHLLLSGERLAAADASRSGLIYDVVKSADLNDRVNLLITSIMAGSSSALAITKEHLHRCGNERLDDQLAMSIQVSAEARETDDAREGLAAFLEKRKPSWQTEP
ncbi:MAG: enoyl-CoA hydratase/isomerase family protein [Mariniblastus sp.]|nr:enoyl-CoA hydratase/isomerase family protein [Mariniblastus sp.]